MNWLKVLPRIAIVVAVLAFYAAPAMAFTATPAGTCTGADGTVDCVTATGHMSASVAATLSINEKRAISFGNMAVSCAANDCTGGAKIVMDDTGTRTVTNGGGDTILLLHGAQANDGAGGNPGAVPSGAQSPGHYLVTGANEGAGTDSVYISFATNAGAIIDISGDSYNPGNKVTLTRQGGGEIFTADEFTFNETGNDVYGHYITSPAGTVDVIVGATLHTDGSATVYAPGKYVGTFDVMVSY